MATPSRLGGKPPRVINASNLVDAKPKCSSYENALVSSQGHSWALFLNPTQWLWLESTNLTKRGLGRATKANSLLEMAWDLSNITRNSNPHLKKAWGIYTPKRRKLAVGPRAAPVRPVPHTVRPVFEKLVVGASGTGQTRAPDRSGSRHPQNLFLRN
jgi:hypothetical protein